MTNKFWDNASQRPFTNVEAPQFVGKNITILCLAPRSQLTSQPAAMQGFSDFLIAFGYAGQFPNLTADLLLNEQYTRYGNAEITYKD
ncbi:MAG: hypothetical protein H0X36_02525 [Sphingomonadaceae bacterium]|nr:hypothetical protein [Sphingomonadaceae bacterium]